MNYPGNKNISGVREKIKCLISPFDLFVEVFCGSAAVSQFISAPADKLWLNDISKDIAEHFVYTGKGYKLTHLCGIELLQQFVSSTPPGNAIFFHDPPYLHSTRPNSLNLYVLVAIKG